MKFASVVKSLIQAILFSEGFPSFHRYYRSFHQQMELIICILIIGLLSALAITYYLPCKSKAVLIHFTSYRPYFIHSQIHYAIEGIWPADEKQMKRHCPVFEEENECWYGNEYVKNIQLNEGAIHFTYRKELEGQTLTLRPAVPKDDPSGPVIWVAGADTREVDWTVFGEDRSNVDEKLINQFLK